MKQYYDVNDVAEKLKLDPQTIYRWLDSGKLKASKAGRCWRITEQDVKDALKSPGLINRLVGLLELDSEQADFLEDYEDRHGKDGLKRLLRDAVECKRKKAGQ